MKKKLKLDIRTTHVLELQAAGGYHVPHLPLGKSYEDEELLILFHHLTSLYTATPNTMHFERSLKRAVYEPWRAEYIDYQKLKNLLRDNGSDDGSADEGDKWTDEDEGKFVDELVNVQLERVANFQSSMVQKLKERTANCESKLEPIVNKAKDGEENEEPATVELNEESKKTIQEVLKELDGITGEMNELEKYSRINYTGFLKATKKHDRRRGASYRVRPLMQVRLAALPFNKEDYSPLLFRLSTMYSFARQQLEEGKNRTQSVSQSGMDQAGYTTHKCKRCGKTSGGLY